MKAYEKIAADYIEACKQLEEAQRRVSIMQEAMKQTFKASEQFGRQISIREMQVLTLLVKLNTNKEIAKELKISERTVKFHVSNLLAKHGVKSRTQLVVMGASQLKSQQSEEADTPPPSRSRCHTFFRR